MSSPSFQSVPLQDVRDYWNRRPCNVRHSPKPVGSRAYFDEVEARKYLVEPHIPSFAQFERWAGKRVLEIGCGIGTDTISFARAGAAVTAVDLSEQSLDLARRRAAVYGLEDRIRFVQADAEQLADALPAEPYDLVYTFGVIHHTPHPGRILDQARQCMRPGSELKVMVYHRRAWKVLQILFTQERWRIGDIERIVAQHSEAQTGCPITHIYTRAGGRRFLEDHGFAVSDLSVEHIFSYAIKPYKQYRYVRQWPWRVTPAPIFRRLEHRFGWHLCMTAKLGNDEGTKGPSG